MGGFWTYCQITKLMGGAEENRSPDLRVANTTLSQLIYGRTHTFKSTHDPLSNSRRLMGKFCPDYWHIAMYHESCPG